MSLIQEALKRQQAEFGDDQPPKLPGGNLSAAESAQASEQLTATEPRPATEPNPADNRHPPALSLRKSVPLPEDTPPPLPADVHRPWLGFFGIALAGLFILALAIYLVFYAIQHFRSIRDVEVAQPVPSAAAVAAPAALPAVTVPSAASAADAAAAPPPAVPSVLPADNQILPASPPAAPTASTPAVAAPPAAIMEPAAAPPEAVAANVVPAAPPAPAAVPSQTAAVPAPAIPVTWPRLNLTGVLCSAVPGEGAARINNTMIFVGGEIDGVTLLKIQEDGVLLRCQHETRFLRVGATLY